MNEFDGPPVRNELIEQLLLTPKAHAAMLETTVRDSVSKTDAINSMLQIGNAVSRLEPNTMVSFENAQGETVHLVRANVKKNKWLWMMWLRVGPRKGGK